MGNLYQEGPPPLDVGLKNVNYAKEQWGIIGGPPVHFFNSLFATLLDQSYFYLLACGVGTSTSTRTVHHSLTDENEI